MCTYQICNVSMSVCLCVHGLRLQCLSVQSCMPHLCLTSLAACQSVDACSCMCSVSLLQLHAASNCVMQSIAALQLFFLRSILADMQAQHKAAKTGYIRPQRMLNKPPRPHLMHPRGRLTPLYPRVHSLACISCSYKHQQLQTHRLHQRLQ